MDSIETISADPFSAPSTDVVTIDCPKKRSNRRPDSPVLPLITISMSSDEEGDSTSTSSSDSDEEKHKKREKHKKHKKYKKHEKHEKRRHHHLDKNTSKGMIELVEMFGEPTVDYSSGRDPRQSFAVWTAMDLKSSGFPHMDRLEFHHRPVDHLKTTVRLKIPAEKLSDVLRISDALTYDRMSNRLTATTAQQDGGWKVNAAILYLASRLVAGQTDLDTMRKKQAVVKMTRKAGADPGVADRYMKNLKESLLSQ